MSPLVKLLINVNLNKIVIKVKIFIIIYRYLIGVWSFIQNDRFRAKILADWYKNMYNFSMVIVNVGLFLFRPIENFQSSFQKGILYCSNF